jgi:hypothetical protein
MVPVESLSPRRRARFYSKNLWDIAVPNRIQCWLLELTRLRMWYLSGRIMNTTSTNVESSFNQDYAFGYVESLILQR